MSTDYVHIISHFFTILAILFRQVVSTKFQRFRIVYLCTMGCRLTTLLLFLILHRSISFCFYRYENCFLLIPVWPQSFSNSPPPVPRCRSTDDRNQLQMIYRYNRFQSRIDSPSIYIYIICHLVRVYYP